MSKDEKRFSARFNMSKPKDVAAFEIISQIPYGERGAYVIDAIIEKNDAPPLKSTLMYVKDSIEKKIDNLSETIQKSKISINSEQGNTSQASVKKDAISNEVMDFIKGL